MKLTRNFLFCVALSRAAIAAPVTTPPGPGTHHSPVPQIATYDDGHATPEIGEYYDSSIHSIYQVHQKGEVFIPPVVNEIVESPHYAGSSEVTDFDNEVVLSALHSTVLSPPIDEEYFDIPSVVDSSPSEILSNDNEPAATVSRISKRQAYGYSRMSGWNSSPTAESPTWGEAWGSLTSTISSAWDSTKSAWDSTKSWWQGDNYANAETSPIAIVEPTTGFTAIEPVVPATPANGGLWDSVKELWKGDTAAAPVVSVPDLAASPPPPPDTNTGIWASVKNWWSGDSATASPAALDIPLVPEIPEEPKNSNSEWSWLSAAKNWWKGNESPEMAIPEIPIPDIDLPIPNFETTDLTGSMNEMPAMPAPPEIAPPEIPFSSENLDIPLPSVDTLPAAEIDYLENQDEDGQSVWVHKPEVLWTIDEDGTPIWLGDPALGEWIVNDYNLEAPPKRVSEYAGWFDSWMAKQIEMEDMATAERIQRMSESLPDTDSPPMLEQPDEGYTSNNDLSTVAVITDQPPNVVDNGFVPFSESSAPPITSPTIVHHASSAENLDYDEYDQESIRSFDFSHSDNSDFVRSTYDSDSSFASEFPDSFIYGLDSKLPSLDYKRNSFFDADSILSDDHNWPKSASPIKVGEVLPDDELPDAYDPYDVPVRGFIPIPPSTNELFGWDTESDSITNSDYGLSSLQSVRDYASSIRSTESAAYGSDVYLQLD
ncbi:hypothetical protein BZA77DRAFT_370265 [Pyronema omphalodes]|nr:hypothetical protein BZA77DRAFT_370265 [Pyronema omphalodes]